MAQEKIKVVIADSQFLIVESLKTLLNGSDQFEVVSTISNKELLLWQIQKKPADLLVIDQQGLMIDGMADLKEITLELPNLKVLSLVNSIEYLDVLKLKNIGIQNVILKTADRDELFRALCDTMLGKKFYSDPIMELLLKSKEPKSPVEFVIQLTVTEKEIVRLIVEGVTTKEIAERKYISFHTVMTHRKNIFRKLSINSASELVMYAVKAGILDTIEYHI